MATNLKTRLSDRRPYTENLHRSSHRPRTLRPTQYFLESRLCSLIPYARITRTYPAHSSGAIESAPSVRSNVSAHGYRAHDSSPASNPLRIATYRFL